MELKIIAHIRTDFPEKFGIPRQPGVVAGLRGKIVFMPEYRNADMLRGLDEFSHLWVLWQFSGNLDENGEAKWSPTVRPPRLGGNKRIGVFATRSPFRPNPIGMSAVKTEHIEYNTEDGPVIYVTGADMMDMTPIYDIKPYIGYSDSISGTTGGFTDAAEYKKLRVIFDTELPKDDRFVSLLTEILENDPRPHYHNDPERIYGLSFAGHNIRFRVEEDVLTVFEIK